MGNIEVHHSNDVNIVYTEGAPADGDLNGGVALAWSVAIVLGFHIFGPEIVVSCLLVVGACWALGKVITAVHVSVARHRAQQAVIADRADAQHAAVMRGDLTAGVHGLYPPERTNP